MEKTKTIVFEPTKSSRVKIKPKAFQAGEVDYHSFSLSPIEMQIYYHIVTILEDGEQNQSDICSAVRRAWNRRDSIKPSAKRIRKVLEKLDRQDWRMERGEKNAAIYSLVEHEQNQVMEVGVEEVIYEKPGTNLEVDTPIKNKIGSKLPETGASQVPNCFQTASKVGSNRPLK